MDNLTNIIGVLGKTFLLIFIVIYIIFSAVIYLNVRRLNAYVKVSYSNLSGIIQLLFIIHLIIVVSLFFLTLVIL